MDKLRIGSAAAGFLVFAGAGAQQLPGWAPPPRWAPTQLPRVQHWLLRAGQSVNGSPWGRGARRAALSQPQARGRLAPLFLPPPPLPLAVRPEWCGSAPFPQVAFSPSCQLHSRGLVPSGPGATCLKARGQRGTLEREVGGKPSLVEPPGQTWRGNYIRPGSFLVSLLCKGPRRGPSPDSIRHQPLPLK